MKPLRLALSLLLAVAGVGAMLWLMRHGINYQDEPYQMLNAAEYLHSPMAPLSAWLGHAWSSLFGFTLLNFRILAVICAILSVAVPSAFLYRRTRMSNLSIAVFGAGTLWLALVPAKSYLYGWDSLSTLLLVVVMLLCVSYLQRPSAKLATLLGIAVALATLARIPNVAAIPVVAAAILLGRGSAKNKALRLAAFLAVFAAVGLACLTAIYCSPSAYFASFGENVISGHSFPYLVDGYLRTLIPALRFSALALAILLCAKVFPGIGSMAVVAIVLAFGATLPSFPLATTANFLSLGLLTAVIILSDVRAAKVVLIVLLSLCATAGSDMGFEKVITIQAVVILAALSGSKTRRAVFLGGSVMLALSLWVEIPAQRELAFEDKGFARTTVRVASTPFAGVFTTSEKATEIQAIDSLVVSWHDRGGRVLVVGDCFRFAADLISGEPRFPATRHVYLLDSPEYFSEVSDALSATGPSAKPLMVIASRPFDWRFPDIEAHDRFPVLRSCRRTLTDSFTIYYPSGD